MQDPAKPIQQDPIIAAAMEKIHNSVKAAFDACPLTAEEQRKHMMDAIADFIENGLPNHYNRVSNLTTSFVNRVVINVRGPKGSHRVSFITSSGKRVATRKGLSYRKAKIWARRVWFNLQGMMFVDFDYMPVPPLERIVIKQKLLGPEGTFADAVKEDCKEST